MIRIFNHYVNANVIVQMILDFAFVLLAMLVFGTVYLQSPLEVSATASHSLSLAAWTFVVGSATGIYQESPNRTLQQSVTRALVATLLMLPLAYGIFVLIPAHIASSSAMAYAAMGTVAAVIAHRTLGGRIGKLAVMQSRILILGTGPVAKQVSESLLASDPHARIVGFLPGPNEQGHSVPE